MGAPFLAPFARSGPLQGLQSGRPLLEKRGNWEGTIRAESNPTTRAFSESLAFAPFGERYALKGAPYNVDSFTGSPDQLVSDEYDFTAREEHGGQGRWISPDPMRGTGNKYAYADNDPLSKIDLGGLLPDCLGCAEMQAWFDSEINRPDPLEESESHAPYASQSEGMASGLSAYGFEPVVQMNLVQIRGDDFLAEFVGFRTQKRDVQSREDRYQRLQNTVGVNVGMSKWRLHLAQCGRDY
ncbi:MAG: RHS repeat-associated core domain-containing protein [Terriglobales bacterium]